MSMIFKTGRASENKEYGKFHFATFQFLVDSTINTLYLSVVRPELKD